MSKRSSRRAGNKDATTAEHVTQAISALLLLMLLGGIAFLELRRGDEPARIVVTPDYAAAEQDEGAWYLPVTIRNVGDRATDVLRVDVVRPVEGEEPEVAEFDFAFVAGGEEVQAIAVFDEEPTADTIEVDVVSVTEP